MFWVLSYRLSRTKPDCVKQSRTAPVHNYRFSSRNETLKPAEENYSLTERKRQQVERILEILEILGIHGKNHIDPQQHEASRFWFRPTAGSGFCFTSSTLNSSRNQEENMKINQISRISLNSKVFISEPFDQIKWLHFNNVCNVYDLINIWFLPHL